MKRPANGRRGRAAAVWDSLLFETFYRQHVDAVTRFMTRRVDDPHTVADLTAEVFLALIDSGHSYRPGHPRDTAWLYGIARTIASAERRRVARESVLSSRIAGQRLLEPDDIARLEDRLTAESDGRRALAALADLPEGQRAVLELIVVDQLTLGEAAAVLGISRITARVRLHRARGTLKAATGTEVPSLTSALVRSGSNA